MSEEKLCNTCKLLEGTFCTSVLYCMDGSGWQAKSKLVDENPIKASDPINHPAHYTAYPGVEVIQIIEHLNFCRGNAVKYICRAGLKNKEAELEDLKKAQWYINREISRMEKK